MTRARATAPDLREPFASATQSRTASAFGPLLAEPPRTTPRPVPTVAPRVSAYATERARIDLTDHYKPHVRESQGIATPAAELGRALAERLATVGDGVDLVALVGPAVSPCDRLLAPGRARVALRVYASALDGWARVRRDVAGPRPESRREREALADAVACEAHAASVRRRMEQ